MRNVRQMVTRVAKNGYVAEVRRVREIPPGELHQIGREQPARFSVRVSEKLGDERQHVVAQLEPHHSICVAVRL